MRVTTPFTDLRAEIRDLVESFGPGYFRERYREREYPHELYDAVVDRGLVAPPVPEAYGGPGRSHAATAVVVEELARHGYDFAMPVLLSTTGACTLLDHGTEAQRERFLPPLCAGDLRFTIGLTEPDSGSDAAAVSTTARRDGDEYVVDGEKVWQSGAGVPGNHVACYVRTDPESERREGLSLLLVPAESDGVTAERLDLVARKAAGTYRLAFDGVRVPVGNRVGEEGAGWTVLGDHLVREHTYMAAAMAGNAREAVDEALAVAAERERFGRPIGDFQAVSHRLADADAAVEAARLLAARAATAIDEGDGSREHAARAKLTAGETLHEAATVAMRTLGGDGLRAAADVGRHWREGASAVIAGGTSDVQRSVLASRLLDA
ncbi:MAG: acyl-CoA dehydrogenase family protein [Haloferacaceae archaeon]